MTNKTIIEEWKELPAGWKAIALVGGILIIQAIFNLGFDISFSFGL